MLIEVVVYLDENLTRNESIWVRPHLTKEEITNEVNNRFSWWFSYDILTHPDKHLKQ